MDPIDILGGLLGGGKSSGGGGLGGKILGELLKGSRRKSAPPARSPSSPAPRRRGGSLGEKARELEDLLGVANERRSGSTTSRLQPRTTQHRPSRPPSFEDVGTRYRPGNTQVRVPQPPTPPPVEQDEEVLVLIRAMINAAKADGRVNPAEQQEILDRISNPTRETIDFLKSEFAKPVDVREFAWNVPLGLEEKVYMLSLAAIDLDTNPEATYFRDLAHGLRLEPHECNDIHKSLGAPTIF